MSGTFEILPPLLRESIAKFSEATGYDPETVIAGWLAHDEIKKLPRSEQAKAIAVVVRLYEFSEQDR